MDNFEIEEGIEIPVSKRGARGTKYPYAQLEVGQSFLVPTTGSKEGDEKKQKSLLSTSHRFGKENDCKFTVRLVPDEGIRVWRKE